MNDKKRIVVAMSGGVDSSTVAAMLVEQGHDVIGVTMQLYDMAETLKKKGACCAGQDIYDAKMTADKLGIPHYVLNYENRFKNAVIEEFADSYLRGETPIPCIKCNQTVKFTDLFKMAKDLGAASLATGHYVRKIHGAKGVELHRGIDRKKDQSYFLFATTKEQLEFVEFPLGEFSKEQTRELAKKYGLEVADKPDSQDICFVPNGDYSSVIERIRPGALDEGNIVDINGKIIGKHNGIINYTIGQRRGIGIANSEPLYVVQINPQNNTIVVGAEIHLQKVNFSIKDVNWLLNEEFPVEGIKSQVKIRSSHEGCEAIIKKSPDGYFKVQLLEYQKSVTPGQACVAYDNTRVLGGGWISNIN
jgi:tRNA-specific 2-thiouridylase